jgi:hypothetical protein
MLSPASWLDRAKALPPNGRARVDHDCGGGRTLTIRNDDQGLHAYCFRCNDRGWEPPPALSLAERLAKLAKQKEQDDKISKGTDLPAPQVRVWSEWPEKSRLWLVKAGLTSGDLPRLGAYYHPPSDRVVLPVLSPSGGVLFWQARATDGRVPKYMAPDIPKDSFVPIYGKAKDVTLTEDLLSAYKVGTVAEGWSMMGTSLSRLALSLLVSRGCKVNVWLDPDPAGNKGATKTLAMLRAAGVEARKIVSTKDPKLHSRAEIKELLL